MGGSVKQALGAVLPVLAAVAVAFVPALAPFAALIVGGAGLVGSFLSKSDMGLGEWDQQAQDAELLKANNHTTQRTVPVVYGRRKVGSNDVFMEMAGDGDDRRLWIVSCLCEGEIEGISEVDNVPQIYIDDLLVTEFNIKHEDEGDGPIVEYFFHNGSSTQVVDPNIHAVIPKFDDTMRDTAYLVWKINYLPGLFLGLPKRQVVIKGLKVFDHRIGFKAWTDNPVWHLYDFLTDDRYGVALRQTVLNQPSFDTAANYCEDESYKAAWKVNYAIVSQIKSQSVLDTILAHFRGSLSWFDGIMSLHYSDLRAEVSVANINDSDISRDADGRPDVFVSQPSSQSAPDAVLVKYVSEQKQWTLDDVYIGDSNGQIKQLEFPGFTDRKLAMDMGTYMLEREKVNRAYSFSTRPSTIVLDPNDVITVDSSELFLAGKEARVLQSDFLPNGLIRINIVVEQESLYNSVYDSDPAEAYRLNIALPNEPPPSIGNVEFTESVYSNRKRSFVNLYVTFDKPTFTEDGLAYPWWDHANVYSSTNPENEDWSFLFSVVDDFIINNVAEGTIFLRIVSVSTSGQRQAFDKAYTKGVTVRGVSEIPPDSEPYFNLIVNDGQLIVYGPILNNPDIAGYELRLGNSWHSNLWEDAALLTFTSKPTVSFSVMRGGPGRIFMDVKSQNGLYSGSPVFQDFNIKIPKLGYKLSSGPGFLNPFGISFVNGEHHGTQFKDEEGETVLQVFRDENNPDVMTGYYDSPVWELPVYTGSAPRVVTVESKWALFYVGTNWFVLAPFYTPVEPPEVTPVTTWLNISPEDDPKTWGQLFGNAGDPSTLFIEVLESSNPEGPFELAIPGAERADIQVLQDNLKFRFIITDTKKTPFFTAGPVQARLYERIPTTP
jgi:hypothetical protein